LSQALLAQNQPAEAERVATEAVDQGRQNLGIDNPLTKAASENLAAVKNRLAH
jgi:hypothetical protein